MYRKRNLPATVDRVIDEEFSRVEQALYSPLPILQLSELNKEPAKLIAGMVVLADGTNWNPGAGSGFYGYRAGAWRFLG